MWAIALRFAAASPGWLSARSLAEVGVDEIADAFLIGGETVADPGQRAALWRDLATGLEREYGGEPTALLAAADRRLGGPAGRPAGWALCGLLGPAGQEVAAAREDLRAPRLARGRRPRALGGVGRHVLMRLALRSGWSSPASRPGQSRDPRRLQARRRRRQRWRRRCSTTCSGTGRRSRPSRTHRR